MTTVVSVSDFRSNISDYLDLLVAGREVVVENGRRRGKSVTLVAKKADDFDWDRYIKFVKSVGGKLFTDQDVKDIKNTRLATNKRFKSLNW